MLKHNKCVPVYFWLLTSCCLWFLSCRNSDKNKVAVTASPIEAVSKDKTEIKFAERFSVTYEDGYKLVTVNRPWRGANGGFSYALVNRGEPLPTLPDSVTIIQIPIQQIVCTSTSHLPAIEYLGEIEKLVGFPNTKYICSENIRDLIAEGGIREIGSEAGLNVEELMALEPDMVIDFAMGNEYDNYQVIKKIGIPVVISADYMENTPLGRAEWIKFTSLFFNKEKKADSIFDLIHANYDSLVSLASGAEKRPSVYSGKVYSDIWYVPGGNNFGAKFLADAHGEYLWADDPSSGSSQLSFEAVYDKAHKADFWIGLGSFNTLTEIKNMDIRYTNFGAFKKGNVYNYNARMGSEGGNEFLELGYLRPDIVVADLIKILHPDLLPGYKLYFYQKLED